MKQKTLFMETTEVPAERTAAEISACLIGAGATQSVASTRHGTAWGKRGR